MGLLTKLHGEFVFPRRVKRLARTIAQLIPDNAWVLDVGCGDGRLASEIVKLRPDVLLQGIEVLIRPKVFVPVTKFDGEHIPYENGAFDVVMFVDVLHHTDDPGILLQEAKRVARKLIVIKDHGRDGFLAGTRLRFMDWVGNARHGVRLPYNYWSRDQWQSQARKLALKEEAWNEELHLYPWWADWIFGGQLQFISQFECPPGADAAFPGRDTHTSTYDNEAIVSTNSPRGRPAHDPVPSLTRK